MIYHRFCEEIRDDRGEVVDIKVHCEDSFNFAVDVVDEIAKETPGKLAMVWCGKNRFCKEEQNTPTERFFTFRDMSILSKKAANVFQRHGVKKGDRVMLLLKRHYQYWYALLGLCRLGATAIPSTHMLTASDIIYRVNAANVTTIVCTPDEDIPTYVNQAKATCASLKTCFIASPGTATKHEGFFDFDAEMEQAEETYCLAQTKATDPMLLYFTSGTTGEPKGVLHDYAYPLAHIVTAAYWHGVSDGDLHLTLADTGWAKAAWGKLYGEWLCGSAVMVYDYDLFLANDILKLIEAYRVTSFCAPPTIYRYLLRQRLERYDLSSLREVTTAGEAISEDTHKSFLSKTGLSIRCGYGQTETTLLLANLVGHDAPIGSMGQPTPYYSIILVDNQGAPVNQGETGEVVVTMGSDERRPVGVFSGYDGNQEQYEEAFEGGVYHTGDLARCDQDGYYWFVARKDDVIKSSGYRVGPTEVENVLMMHPAVLECAVTGVLSRKRGQVIKATIVLREGYPSSEELKTEIQDFVKREAAMYKYPRLVEFVDRLPKTTNGKVKRDAIRLADAETIVD